EGHPLDIARNPGPNIDLVHRLEPPGKLVPLGNFPLRNRSDGNGLEWRRGRRFIVGAAVEGERRQGDTSQSQGACEDESPNLHDAVPPRRNFFLRYIYSSFERRWFRRLRNS